MNLTRIGKFIVVFALISFLLWPNPSSAQQTATGEAESFMQINLALRQVADRLLDASGDSVTTIPPIEERGTGVYVVNLNAAILYDSLPVILEHTFQRHHIAFPYEVALLDCKDQMIVLGFTSEDIADGSVPCLGREQIDSCYQLTVSFNQKSSGSSSHVLWAGLLTLAAAGLIWPVLYSRRRRSFEQHQLTEEDTTSSSLLQFGSSQLDVERQLLSNIGGKHKLTYRETKLLSVLASQPNKVLAREELLGSVWEDEGIMVGRSLDVFISRLRKKIKDDPNLNISNAHGVGYKLEVAERL